MTSFPMREWIKLDHSSIPPFNSNDIRGRERERENRHGNRHRWKVRGGAIERVCKWSNGLVTESEWQRRTTQEMGMGVGEAQRWWLQSRKGLFTFIPVHLSVQPLGWHKWHHRKKRERGSNKVENLKQGQLMPSIELVLNGMKYCKSLILI